MSRVLSTAVWKAGVGLPSSSIAWLRAKSVAFWPAAFFRDILFLAMLLLLGAARTGQDRPPL